jgi:transketolase
MRKEFASLLHSAMSENENIILLTGDLGYGLWDRIKIDYPDRFYNTLSAEQLMLGTAIGMAMDGKIPVVYSITSFAIYRPFELIRNYLNHENIPVKIVGGGRDKEYGYLGFSHWAEEDIDILSNFKNLNLFKPKEFNLKLFNTFMFNNKPSYLNLSK